MCLDHLNLVGLLEFIGMLNETIHDLANPILLSVRKNLQKLADEQVCQRLKLSAGKTGAYFARNTYSITGRGRLYY